MKKEALLNYIAELKQKSKTCQETFESELEALKEKNTDKEVLRFTLGEHLYIVKENLDNMIWELESIIEEEESKNE